MPVTATEQTRLSDVLKTTENQLWTAGYNSDVLTVPSAIYTIGQLLGKVTATGAWVISDPVATDGSEVPVAVVAENTTVAATSVLALVRGPAIVADGGLVLGDHVIADAIAGLESANPPIVVAAQL